MRRVACSNKLFGKVIVVLMVGFDNVFDGVDMNSIWWHAVIQRQSGIFAEECLEIITEGGKAEFAGA